ncbi:phosphoglycerate dehydrogenase [Bacteroidia bacterium]|nr:phosphoglycerate dehydrogenase [Bacteroidia bacterium]
MEKVLVVDDVFESLLIGLEKHLGAEIHYYPDINPEKIPQKLSEDNYTGLVVRSKIRISRDLLSHAPILQWIARAGSGIDNIDEEIVDDPTITVINADGANAHSVAEHVLGMILAFQHRLLLADQHVRMGEWDREAHRGTEIRGKTIGIVGVGHTGSALAKVLSGFGAHVIGYDKYKLGFTTDYVEQVDFEDLCVKSDVISFHVPLSEETHSLIGADFFGRISRKPLVINASRGKIMDLNAAISALEKGQISGLCLDVLPDEPPLNNDGHHDTNSYRRLFEFQDLMFSPHVAGWSKESYRKISDRLLENILKYKGL